MKIDPVQRIAYCAIHTPRQETKPQTSKRKNKERSYGTRSKKKKLTTKTPDELAQEVAQEMVKTGQDTHYIQEAYIDSFKGDFS